MFMKLVDSGSLRLTVALSALTAVGCAEMGAPASGAGHVVHSEGAGAPEGASCRAAIECGGRPLYGGPILGGYTNCEAREGRWTRVWDHWLAHEDGDPYLDWDVVAGTLEVRTRDGSTRVDLGG